MSVGSNSIIRMEDSWLPISSRHESVQDFHDTYVLHYMYVPSVQTVRVPLHDYSLLDISLQKTLTCFGFSKIHKKSPVSLYCTTLYIFYIKCICHFRLTFGAAVSQLIHIELIKMDYKYILKTVSCWRRVNLRNCNAWHCASCNTYYCDHFEQIDQIILILAGLSCN